MQLKDIAISSLVGCRVVREMPVGEVTRLPLRPDVFMGIEIEGEGYDANEDGYSGMIEAGWRVVDDPSLRDSGVELVLREPLAGEKLAYAVTSLFNQVRERNVVWDTSPRAGTHFHVNASDKTMGFVQAFTALAYCIDELIFAFAGEDRRWCSYCNSLNTLSPVVLRLFLVNREVGRHFGGWHNVWPLSEADRYYGFNVASLDRFGTLELRYFPSPTSEKELWSWMDLCQTMYTIAERFAEEENPAQAVIDYAIEHTEAMLGELPMLPSMPESVREAAEELHIIISTEVDSGEGEMPTVRYEELTPQGELREASRSVFPSAGRVTPGWEDITRTARLRDPLSAASWLTTFDDEPSQQEND